MIGADAALSRHDADRSVPALCRIVVVLLNRVIVHSFTNQPERLNLFETADNDKGSRALFFFCPKEQTWLMRARPR